MNSVFRDIINLQISLKCIEDIILIIIEVELICSNRHRAKKKKSSFKYLQIWSKSIHIVDTRCIKD